MLNPNNGTPFCYYPAQPTIPDPVVEQEGAGSCPSGYGLQNPGSSIAACVEITYGAALGTSQMTYSCANPADALDTVPGGGSWQCTPETTIAATLTSGATTSPSAPTQVRPPIPISTSPFVQVTTTLGTSPTNTMATSTVSSTPSAPAATTTTQSSLCVPVTAACVTYFTAVLNGEEQNYLAAIAKSQAAATAVGTAHDPTAAAQQVASSAAEETAFYNDLANSMASSTSVLNHVATKAAGSATVTKQSTSVNSSECTSRLHASDPQMYLAICSTAGKG
jgi:hypothetical protein